MFKLVKILNRGVNVAEGIYLPTQNGAAYTLGEAVKLSGGVVVPATATDTPTHIVGECLTAGERARVFCYPVCPDMVFETTFSAAPTGVAVGDKVTLGIEGGKALSVTATKTSGVAEIHYMANAFALGDAVLVRFS